jgi:FAD/FMN-containing dehydrogenase
MNPSAAIATRFPRRCGGNSPPPLAIVSPATRASSMNMAATRASGSNALRYGTMRENVVGQKIVTAAGDIVTTARRTKKSSAGIDLMRRLKQAWDPLNIMNPGKIVETK